MSRYQFYRQILELHADTDTLHCNTVIVSSLAEAVCFVEAWNRTREARHEPLIQYVDISQTVTRMAQSTTESKALDIHGKGIHDRLMIHDQFMMNFIGCDQRS